MLSKSISKSDETIRTVSIRHNRSLYNFSGLCLELKVKRSVYLLPYSYLFLMYIRTTKYIPSAQVALFALLWYSNFFLSGSMKSQCVDWNYSIIMINPFQSSYIFSPGEVGVMSLSWGMLWMQRGLQVWL